jgi:hypothetical protein
MSKMTRIKIPNPDCETCGGSDEFTLYINKLKEEIKERAAEVVSLADLLTICTVKEHPESTRAVGAAMEELQTTLDKYMML